MLKKLFGQRNRPEHTATVIARNEHIISRKNISSNALKVLYRLHEAGYSAYLVGGSVRDLLLGRNPKDFDVATDANPEQVKQLFRNCLLIGRRFRLAHIRFGYEIIEVATFRAMPKSKWNKSSRIAEHGMLLRDNVYGTLEEDAERRDFTINALYYNIADYSVVDYWGGVQDLQQGIIRMIGDPRSRYHEDPVRLLRAVRFAGKLNFKIDSVTAAPIIELSPLLQHVPAARLFEETLKLFHSGKSLAIFHLLNHYQLFQQLFPQTAACLNQPKAKMMLELACTNTDARIAAGKSVSAGFLFACLLWHPLHAISQSLLAQGHSFTIARNIAAHKVIAKQMEQVTIPRRFTIAAREIWNLQEQLENRKPKQVLRLLTHPRFRAAYDFLLLRASVSELSQTLADWWTQFYESDAHIRHQLTEQLPKYSKKRRKNPFPHE